MKKLFVPFKYIYTYILIGGRGTPKMGQFCINGCSQNINNANSSKCSFRFLIIFQRGTKEDNESGSTPIPLSGGVLTSQKPLYFAHEQQAKSDPVIIPYKVVNIRLITLYGIITGSLSAYYQRASYSYEPTSNVSSTPAISWKVVLVCTRLRYSEEDLEINLIDIFCYFGFNILDFKYFVLHTNWF